MCKILIAICSAHIHKTRRTGVRKTWMRRLPTSIKSNFFVGIGPPIIEQDLVVLDIDDSYAALPAKIQQISRYFIQHTEFDYLFKCDDDTYVLGERLTQLTDIANDLVGCKAGTSRPYVYGGAGYLMSRSAAEIIANAPTPQHGAEDIWVSKTLAAAKIVPLFSSALLGSRKDFPRQSNNIITSHDCSPALMKLIDAGIDNPDCISVVHKYEVDGQGDKFEIALLKNRRMISANNAVLGFWRVSSDALILELKWDLDNKSKDILRKVDNGYENNFIQLTNVTEEKSQVNVY